MSEISGANVGWLGFGGISGGSLGMPGMLGTPTGEETKKESPMKRPAAEAENAGQSAAGSVAPPNKVPRRIEPVSVASSSAAPPPAAPPMPEERRADSVGNDDDSEVDPAHLEELRQLSEEEQQALIDDYFAKKEAHDDAVLMLERGSDRRRLGDFHQAVLPERLAAERELLNELREARAGVDDFSALMEDALRDYEEALLEVHEEAIRAWAEAADELEAAGFSVIELERKYARGRVRDDARRMHVLITAPPLFPTGTRRTEHAAAAGHAPRAAPRAARKAARRATRRATRRRAWNWRTARVT